MSNPLLRIEDLDGPPVVGCHYLVPTVFYPWHGRSDDWPVMGPKHNDVEHLAFDFDHYHVDLRFLQRQQVRWLKAHLPHRPIALIASSSPLCHSQRLVFPAPVLRPLVCRWPEHTLMYPHFQGLHEAFAGRRCARNGAGYLICPHKGFDLATLRPDVDGRVVCPLHGLIIDVQVGRVAHVAGYPCPPEPWP